MSSFVEENDEKEVSVPGTIALRHATVRPSELYISNKWYVFTSSQESVKNRVNFVVMIV